MAIANSSDILQAVIEATPDAIFVKDLAGRYVLVNDAFREVHRQGAGRHHRKHLTSSLRAETAQRFIERTAGRESGRPRRPFEDSRRAKAARAGVRGDQARTRSGGDDSRIYGISHDITD